VGIISKLQHPHVVKYFDFTQDRSHYYIVLEVVAGGELFDRIVQRVYYSEKEARDLVWVLLDVLHHIHGKRIAHRDLKPENLLLKSTHNDHDIKLADFGFATEAKKPMRELCGTPAYVAPEIINEKPYGLEVDMWSCGVIVFILLGGSRARVLFLRAGERPRPTRADAKVPAVRRLRGRQRHVLPDQGGQVHVRRPLLGRRLARGQVLHQEPAPDRPGEAAVRRGRDEPRLVRDVRGNRTSCRRFTAAPRLWDA